MKNLKSIFGMVCMTLVCGASPEVSQDKSNQKNSHEEIDKRQGEPYSNIRIQSYPDQNTHYSTQFPSNYVNQYSNSPYQYHTPSNNYDHDSSNSHSVDNIDRQDALESRMAIIESDILARQDTEGLMSMLGIGVAIFAAGAASYALIQNAQQATDIDSLNGLKGRVSSLESDQTNICTTVKSVATASDGKTIDLVLGSNADEESGFIKALADITSPTCS